MRHAAESIGYFIVVVYIAGSLGLMDFKLCIGKVGECAPTAPPTGQAK